MPHISKQKLSREIVHEMSTVLDSVLVEAGERTRKRMYHTLLTKTERLMLAKRLMLLYLIKKEVSGYRISSLLGISQTTVSRYALKVERGVYDDVLSAIRKSTALRRLLRTMAGIYVLWSNPRRQSFGQFIDDL